MQEPHFRVRPQFSMYDSLRHSNTFLQFIFSHVTTPTNPPTRQHTVDHVPQPMAHLSITGNAATPAQQAAATFAFIMNASPPDSSTICTAHS